MAEHEAHIVEPSHWPIVGSIAIFLIMWGFVHALHGATWGANVAFTGGAILLYMIYGWFKEVIRDSLKGLREDPIINSSFRWAMVWFIFSEIMFFATFFGVLFYVRVITLPHLGGEAYGDVTHIMLWPGFENTWPLLKTPDPSKFLGPRGVMETWHLPAINTLILLISGGTITMAHLYLIKHKMKLAAIWQLLTILLGITFLYFQIHEYGIAYHEKGLTLGSGIFGSTFFMLTGFHGFHVTLGTIMLICILYRILRGHFTAKHHFAFEAVAWYWHFVDIVWLGLFVFVYWL